MTSPESSASATGGPAPHSAVRLSARDLLEAGAAAGPVLGIDTGAPVISLGIVAGGRIRGSLSRPVLTHCSGLPEAVDELLEVSGFSRRDLRAVAVAIGPGSFTGLRIGLSYAKGLSMALSIAIVGVPTLDAMALCVPTKELLFASTVCPILDARKGEIYTALYGIVSDALIKMSGDLVIPLADFAPRISSEAVFVGESKADEVRSLVSANGGKARVVGIAGLQLRGSFVATLGAARVADHDFDNIATLEPLYVRPAQASIYSTAVKSGESDHGTSRGRAYPAVCRS
jgi:tRNA threonylcarbamoyladenosine biosynthesis protein TsaB